MFSSPLNKTWNRLGSVLTRWRAVKDSRTVCFTHYVCHQNYKKELISMEHRLAPHTCAGRDWSFQRTGKKNWRKLHRELMRSSRHYKCCFTMRGIDLYKTSTFCNIPVYDLHVDGVTNLSGDLWHALTRLLLSADKGKLYSSCFTCCI